MTNPNSAAQTAAEVALLKESAESFGLEFTESALETTEQRAKAHEAITEISAAKESLPAFYEELEAANNIVFASIKKAAEKSGVGVATEFLGRYESEVKDKISDLAKTGLEKIAGGEKFTPHVKAMAGDVSGILDKGLELAGFHFDRSDPEQEKMRKEMLMLIAMMASLALSHFGVSAQMIALVGMFVQTMSESKGKEPLTAMKDIATKIATDKDFRQALEENVLSAAEVAHPGLKSMGLREKVTDGEKLVEGSRELYVKTKALISSLPSASKAPEVIKNELFIGLERVIENSIPDNPDLADRLKSTLNSIKERDTGAIKDNLVKLAKDGIEARDIPSKAQDLVSTVSSVSTAVDAFKTLANETLSLSSTDKLMLDRMSVEMRKYAYEKYAKPVKDVVDCASKLGAGELASKLGFSRDILKDISSKIASLDSHSLGR